jgi:hypothetical protein
MRAGERAARTGAWVDRAGGQAPLSIAGEGIAAPSQAPIAMKDPRSNM